jgi:Tol biopolymer transport system component
VGKPIGRLQARFAARLVLLALAVLALTGSATGSAAGEDQGWIVLSSDRDGKARLYSVGADGSRLSPLLPPDRRLEGVAVSRDGRTIAYSTSRDFDTTPLPLYVSRADGTGFRQLARKGIDPAFSPNGKLLAFAARDGIWVVRADGGGLRRVTSGRDEAYDWSPDGKALVVVRVISPKNQDYAERFAVVVQPLRGRPRVLFRTGPNDEASTYMYQPSWSPNGRWIAYLNRENAGRRNGLTLVRPNGTGRHRVIRGVGDEDWYVWAPDGRWLAYTDGLDLEYIAPSGAFHKISSQADGQLAWSPDGKRLAFSFFGERHGHDVAVATGDGRKPRLLNLDLGDVSSSPLVWSPDGQRLAVGGSRGGDPDQVWSVGADGRDLRRLTSEGNNGVVAWTRFAPTLPAALPIPAGERVVSADAVATSSPITALSADGQGVAFAVAATPTDCMHALGWTGDAVLTRLGYLRAPCPRLASEVQITPIALAGSRAAWVTVYGAGDECYFTLASATLTDPAPRWVSGSDPGSAGKLCKSQDIDHVRGKGDLLLFNDEPAHASWLRRIGTGGEKCGELRCTTLRKDAQGAPVDSAAEHLLAIRKPTTVRVLDEQGRPVRTFAFAPADVSAARLDGGRLVVARSDSIEAYDVTTGTRVHSRPLPAGYRLTDADGGIAVLRRSPTLVLVRLSDGASLTLTPGRSPVLADLEPPGLYHSYVTEDGTGRVALLARSELLRRLGQ